MHVQQARHWEQAWGGPPRTCLHCRDVQWPDKPDRILAITGVPGHAAEECIAESSLTVGPITTTVCSPCAAEMYGNQDEIGSALAKLMKDGVIKREDVWITSKACASCQHPSQAARDV